MASRTRSHAAGSVDEGAAPAPESRANLPRMSESSAFIWRDTDRHAAHMSRCVLSATRERKGSGRSSASDASRMASLHESIKSFHFVRSRTSASRGRSAIEDEPDEEAPTD